MIVEEQLERWARPLSDTEDQKCINAREQIRNALKARFGCDVRVFTQGSYANNTNIRQDSDIDIVVVHTGFHFPDDFLMTPEHKTQYWGNFQPSQYTVQQFRTDVHELLASEFPGMVDVKNKCLHVRGHSTRMHADVIPCFEHHRMRTPNEIAHVGVSFFPLSGNRIDSFPEQHQERGANKNVQTNRTYKQIVRIIKNLKAKMEEDGDATATPMSSFFIECLIYNVPDRFFNGSDFRSVTREVIAKIWNDMQKPEVAKTYEEVSGLYYLFRDRYTPKQAEDFMYAAWHKLSP